MARTSSFLNPFHITPTNAYRIALDFYSESLNAVLKAGGSINVVVSGLNGQQKALVDTLAGMITTEHGVPAIRVQRDFASNTNLCIADVHPEAEQDLMLSKLRTLTVLRSHLNAVPIVTPTWVVDSVSQRKLADLQYKSYCIKTMPVKVDSLLASPTSNENDEGALKATNDETSRFSVVRAAAVVAQTKANPNKHRPFSGVAVYLCGSWNSAEKYFPKKEDVLHVLNDLGATFVSDEATVGKLIKQQGKEKSERLFILCDDSKSDETSGLTGAL